MLSLSCTMLSCASVYRCLEITCWEKAYLLALIVSLSLSHWYPGLGVVIDLSISDLCPLSFLF